MMGEPTRDDELMEVIVRIDRPLTKGELESGVSVKDVRETHQTFEGSTQVSVLLSFMGRTDLIGEFEVLFVSYSGTGERISAYGCKSNSNIGIMPVVKVEPGDET